MNHTFLTILIVLITHLGAFAQQEATIIASFVHDTSLIKSNFEALYLFEDSTFGLESNMLQGDISINLSGNWLFWEGKLLLNFGQELSGIYARADPRGEGSSNRFQNQNVRLRFNTPVHRYVLIGRDDTLTVSGTKLNGVSVNSDQYSLVIVYCGLSPRVKVFSVAALPKKIVIEHWTNDVGAALLRVSPKGSEGVFTKAPLLLQHGSLDI